MINILQTRLNPVKPLKSPKIGDTIADAVYTKLLRNSVSPGNKPYLVCRNRLERGGGREGGREGEREGEKKGGVVTYCY